MPPWTEERRKKQAEAIKRWKPWERSTGPKTPQGKARAKMNALKHGNYAAWAKEVEQALYHSRAFLKHIGAWVEAERILARHRNELLRKDLKSDG